MTRQSDTELEKRLRSLADTVIKKQTTIEALSSDKSSLLLEIERYKRNPVSLDLNTDGSNGVGLSICLILKIGTVCPVLTRRC